VSSSASAAVQVPPIRHNLIGVLLPMLVWVLVFGGRVLCRCCQRTIPLTAAFLPLPLEVTVALLHHRPR
jgi:hypothetical protein